MSKNPVTAEEASRKVRDLEIRSRRLSTHRVMGEYHTAFRGRGMRYKEVREYQAGDDVRFIDWNVSARLGHPFTKIFEEESELVVMLLVDLSASTAMGSRSARKDDLLAEAMALLAFAAVRNGDRVGAVFFTDRIEAHIPPAKGREHALRLVRRLLTLRPEGKGTDIAAALRYFRNASRRKGVAFVASDFLAPGYEQELRIAAARHDVVGIRVHEPFDNHLPDMGLVRVHDPETGEYRTVDSSDGFLRHLYEEHHRREAGSCREAFRRAGAESIELRTDEDPAAVLHRFFMHRLKARLR
jgi:uncharacterized protein (DUF58 family)